MNIMDKSKAITAEDLIRRYNLEGLKEDRKKTNILIGNLVKTDTLLNNFIETTLQDIEEIQSQIDGNITTWFYSGVPTLNNAPASDWTTDDEKNNHIGDLYYDQDTGYAYRFVLQENVYKWIKIQDTDVAEALAIANSAQDTADSKRRVFVVQPTPPYDVGDIWLKEDKELWRCRASRASGNYNSADWKIATKYTNDDYAIGVEAVLNQFITNVEENYTTHTQLETTKDSIVGIVESETTRVEIITNNNYQELTGKLNEKATIENVTVVSNKVEQLQTDTEWSINHVRNIEENGVNQVHTSNGMSFNENGLNMNREGARTGSLLDETGLEVIDKTGASEITQFFSGVVDNDILTRVPELEDFLNKAVTYMNDTIINNFLKMKHGRWENTTNSTYGNGIGFFPE